MRRNTSQFAAKALLSWLLVFVVGCKAGSTTQARRDTELRKETITLSAVSLDATGRLKAVVTTNIVADVVKRVGGDRIDLRVLLPVGTDPHSFEPTPQDIVAVADSHVVFANGSGLEPFLDGLLANAGANEKTVYVSSGVQLRELGESEEDAVDHEHGSDPHTWTDPANVEVWTENVERALSALDPNGAEEYAANALAYQIALKELDRWIEDRVSQIPETERLLVTDHATFGYFSDRYGFEMIGTVIPGFSTVSEPSAQELARLQDAIGLRHVKAVFAGRTVNPAIAQRMAEDADVKLVYLYTGSLSDQNGPASTYLDMMRYNTTQIVGALE